MAQVDWTIPALEDLDAIHEFIAKDSSFYARQTVERMLDRTRRLEKFPVMGRVVPEFGDPHIRELREGRYRIVYRLTGDLAEVICVWHSARRMLPRGRFK